MAYTHRSFDAAGIDTRDASKVPPSVFAKSVGEPVIAHGDLSHRRAERHGSTAGH